MTLFAYFEVLKDELLYRQNVTSKTYCHLKAQLSKQGLERRVLNKFTLPILKYNCNQSTRLKEAISNFYVCTKHNELEFSSNFLRKLNEKNYMSRTTRHHIAISPFMPPSLSSLTIGSINANNDLYYRQALTLNCQVVLCFYHRTSALTSLHIVNSSRITLSYKMHSVFSEPYLPKQFQRL